MFSARYPGIIQTGTLAEQSSEKPGSSRGNQHLLKSSHRRSACEDRFAPQTKLMASVSASLADRPRRPCDRATFTYGELHTAPGRRPPKAGSRRTCSAPCRAHGWPWGHATALNRRGSWATSGTISKRGAATFPRSDYLRFVDSGSRRRTPGPPPFSAINTTPADSSARWRAAIVGRFAINSPRNPSNRLIVARETFEASLSALCSSRRIARAARSCSLVSKSATIL